VSNFSKIIKKLKKQTKVQLDNDYREQIEEDIDDPAALAASHINMKAKEEIAFIINKPRASSILLACIRMHVIGTVNKIGKKEWSSVRMRVLFGYGNAYHYWIQNTPDLYGNRRVGWWQCRACQKLMYFGHPPKQRCKYCGAAKEAGLYYEHHMDLDGAFPMSGHPDLFLDVNSMLRVNELKSINGEEFDKLKGAKAEHEAQAQTYMWGCGRDKSIPVKIDTEVGYVTYISKKHKVKELPFKMYRIKKNKLILKNIQDKARIYRAGVEHYPESLPDLDGDCDRGDFRNYKAKVCPCRKICMENA
jgi:hypothetical protein